MINYNVYSLGICQYILQLRVYNPQIWLYTSKLWFYVTALTRNSEFNNEHLWENNYFKKNVKQWKKQAIIPLSALYIIYKKY